MADCSRITTGIVFDECDDQAIAGTGPRVILINYADIDRALSVVTDNVITSLILKTGMMGYEVDSLPNATVGEDTINVNTYNNTHQQSVTVRIFKKSEAAKKFVNGSTNARVVALVQNNDLGEDGDTKYEVYGWDAGLKLSDLTFTTELTDGASYVLVYSSDTIAQEKSLPKSFFVTDQATTDEAVEALLTAAVAPGP